MADAMKLKAPKTGGNFMSAGLDKTEQQLKKAHDELAFVREKKADIIENFKL